MSADSITTMMQGLIPLGAERQGIQVASPFLSFLQRGQQVREFQLLPGFVFIQAAFREDHTLSEIYAIFPYTYINGSWAGQYLIVEPSQSTHIHKDQLAAKLTSSERYFFRLQIKLQSLKELDALRDLPNDSAKIAQALSVFNPQGPVFSTIKYDPFRL